MAEKSSEWGGAESDWGITELGNRQSENRGIGRSGNLVDWNLDPMTTPSRKAEIRRRRTRKEKIALLRRRYANAASDTERTRIMEKVHRLAPTMTPDALLAPLRARQNTA